jgi:3-phenylpropionate/trans-cinnamate dioxygenase ferredoxin subunit
MTIQFFPSKNNLAESVGFHVLGEPLLYPFFNIADLEAEDVIGVEINGTSYVVYRISSGYYATDGICTHEQTSLANGFVNGDRIECPKHNCRFHIPSGKAVRRPVRVDLKTYPVKSDRKVLFIGFPA